MSHPGPITKLPDGEKAIAGDLKSLKDVTNVAGLLPQAERML